MKKSDFIVIFSVILISVILAVFLYFQQDDGAYVVVRINGEEVGEYSLLQNGTYTLNDGTNTIQIENKTVYMKDADCPDKLCVHQGKIDKEGQVITCLPNKLTVTVYGTDKTAELIS